MVVFVNSEDYLSFHLTYKSYLSNSYKYLVAFPYFIRISKKGGILRNQKPLSQFAIQGSNRIRENRINDYFNKTIVKNRCQITRFSLFMAY